MTDVIDAYDAALFDLDGVVYLGPEPVPGAPEGLAALRSRGVPICFVTNNAARAPQVVAAQLRGLGIACAPDEVITSGQAGAEMLAEDLPAGARVLVSGSATLAEQVRAVGLRTVTSADDHPDAVIQGYEPTLPFTVLTEAALAVQRGARWFATNADPTRPTDRGLEPGVGAQLAVVRVVVGGEPRVAGKPERPLMNGAARRAGATHPIFVGDRLDTDIAGGRAAGFATMLVLTGAHGPADLFAAPPPARPDHLGRDLRDLLTPPRRAVRTGDTVVCGDAAVERIAHSGGDAVRIVRAGEPLDLIRATARLAWDTADLGDSLDCSAVLDRVGPTPAH